MSEYTTEKLQKKLKTYKVVFAVVIALTVLTALLSRLNVGTGTRIFIALGIAVVQAAFSGSYFMHLNSEKKSIWWFLFLTAAFFALLLLLPLLTRLDPIKM
jgi:caa(3)-type oxidase subunit IV